MGNPETSFLGSAYEIASSRIRDLSERQRRVREAIVGGDSAQDYENVPCLCGATDGEIQLARVERHGLACRNVLCARCGLIRITPRWKEARYQRFYETEYRDLYNRVEKSKAEFADETAATPWVRAFGAWVESRQARHAPGTAMPLALEIGAGAGWNLSRLPASWRKIGYDVDRTYLDIGTSRFGLEMKFGLLSEALTDVPRADVIILSHVVEHFMDPRASLAALAERMRPEALLLIEVPGLFRIHWTALDPMTYLQNAHTYTFCAGTLGAVCMDAGLEVLESDEVCRVVCRRAAKPMRSLPDPSLASRSLRYLRFCEGGYAMAHRFKMIPGAGRFLVAAWKRTYFPFLRTLVPRGTGPKGGL